MKKKITLIITIFILLIFVTFVSITYSILASNVTVNNNVIINTNLAKDAFNFTATGTDALTLNVYTENMTVANANTMIQDYSSFTVSLSSLNNAGLVKCTYDLVWTWDSDDIYTSSSVIPSMNPDTSKWWSGTAIDSRPYRYMNNFQFGLRAWSITNNTLAEYTNSNAYIDFRDFSQMTWNGKKGMVRKGIELYSNSSTPTTTTYYVSLMFVNIQNVQDEINGQYYSGHLSVENVSCDNVTTEPSTVRMISGDLSTVGSEVAFGDQHFYVIPNDVDVDSSYVTLFAKYPLYVGNRGSETYYYNKTEAQCTTLGGTYDADDAECLVVTAETIPTTDAYYLKQKNTDVQYYFVTSDGNYTINNKGFIFDKQLEDCSNYWTIISNMQIGGYYVGSYVESTSVYSNSTFSYESGRKLKYIYNSSHPFYSYIEAYKTKLQNTYGVTISSSKLISFEQLESLGCTSITNKLDSSGHYLVNNIFTCKNAPYYVTFNNYEIGSAMIFYADTTKLIQMTVYTTAIYEDHTTDEEFSSDDADYSAIRPTIVLNKSTLQSKLS